MLDGLHDDMVEKVETALKIGYQLKIEISKIREMVKKIKNHRDNVWRRGYRAGIVFGIKRGVKAAVAFQEQLDATGRKDNQTRIGDDEPCV